MSSPGEIEHLDYILTQVARTQKVKQFELNPDTHPHVGDGFTAQFYTGNIKDKDTGTTINVAIKRAPIWEFDYKLLFNNEILFYSTVFPALDDLQKKNDAPKLFDSLPTYFCGSMEPKREYVAMENLKELGYIMFDKKKYLDNKHLEMIFETYGKFHALSFVLRNQNLAQYEDISKKLTNLTTSFLEFEGKSLQTAFSVAVNALDSDKDNEIYNVAYKISENLMETYTEANLYRGEYKCLIHGDGWSNNMLFKYSNLGELLDMKLIDFQFCREDTPIYDLSYFLYSSGSKEDFDNLDNYLEIYHRSFSKFAKELGGHPNELFPIEILKKEWKDYALIGVIYGIYLWQVRLLQKEDFQELVHSNQGQDMGENANLWESLLKKSSETDLFKEKTTDILKHAYQYEIMRTKTN